MSVTAQFNGRVLTSLLVMWPLQWLLSDKKQNSHSFCLMRQNRQYQLYWLMCNWLSGFGFGLDIGVHNFIFSDMDWIWSRWKSFQLDQDWKISISAHHCILRKCFVTSVLTLHTHVLQPHVRILYEFSVMIQKQFFRVFQLFAPEVKHSIINTLNRMCKSYSYRENDLKRDITVAKNLLRKESKLSTWLEQFFSFTAT